MNDQSCPETARLVTGARQGEVLPVQHGGSFAIGGVTVRVYVSDDGTRIVHAEDAIELFEAIAAGLDLTDEDRSALDRLGRGEAPHA